MQFDVVSLETDLKAAALPIIEGDVIKCVDVLLANIQKQAALSAASATPDAIASALVIAVPLLQQFLDPLLAKALPDAAKV
jgi:hypothetical protein